MKKTLLLTSLVSKGAYRIINYISRRSKSNTQDLVLDHELNRLSPEMLDWWWDHIDNESYLMWHPGDHVSFKWEIAPPPHSGAISQVVEKVGGIPIMLRFRWEDPTAIPISGKYDHVQVACIINQKNEPMSWIIHEYAKSGQGVTMHSVYRLPAKTPQWFINNFRKHYDEEFHYLEKVLPAIYEKQRKSDK